MEFHNDRRYPKLLRDVVYIIRVLREQLGSRWLNLQVARDLWRMRGYWE